MQTQKIPFTKAHGLANDFVILDFKTDPEIENIFQNKEQKTKLIAAFADRKKGVGFDQLLTVEVSKRLHAKMVIYNTDGSKAEMCGNGLRALALYLWKHWALKEQTLYIETDAGDRQATRLGPLEDGLIETEMGIPKFPALKTKFKNGTAVNVGNPHLVFFTDFSHKDFKKKNHLENYLKKNGGKFENHKAFPKRTNVEFCQALNAHQVKAYVWERGVGLTEACGTGAVAVASAAIKKGLCQSPVEVIFPGGSVEVVWNSTKEQAKLRGTAQESFSGVLNF